LDGIGLLQQVIIPQRDDNSIASTPQSGNQDGIA
jgi:hypothetical protein